MLVYLCEQGAVSPNKYTRGNGRKDLFDHVLSKEIFDSGSSLFLFFLFFQISHQNSSPVFVRRVVKRLLNVVTDHHEWTEISWEFLAI